MEPVIDQVSKDIGVEIARLEVWHDKENLQKLNQCDDGSCGGVPFFFNEKSGKTICGEASYEQIKEWALS